MPMQQQQTKQQKTTKKEKQQHQKKSKYVKYVKKLTFGAQVGVEVLNFDLHMARARELPY